MTKFKLAITNPQDIAEKLRNLCKNSSNKEEIQLFVEKYKEAGGNVIEVLLSKDSYDTILLSDICHTENKLELIKYFLEEYKAAEGDLVELFKLQSIRNGATLLSEACDIENNHEAINYLIKEYKTSGVSIIESFSEKSIEQGYNPVHLLSRYENNFALIKYFLEEYKAAKGDVAKLLASTILYSNREPLSLACEIENNFEVIKYFVEEYTKANGRLVELFKIGSTKISQLEYACMQNNNFEVIKYLVEAYERDGGKAVELFNREIKYGLKFTALYYACKVNDNLEVIKYLLNLGDYADFLFRSENFSGIVNQLVAENSDFDWHNYKTQAGFTFLDLSLMYGKMDLVFKFCELPLNNKIAQELQTLESSLIGQVPYFMLKQQEESMKVESNFYKQNPQYKVLGAILEGVSKGELELHIESIQVKPQNIKALLEKLHSSLTELKNILSDLLKQIDAENNLNTSNVIIIDDNEVEVNCLGNGNDDD